MNRKWDFYKKIQLARTDVGKYMAGYFSRRIHNCAATFLRFFSIWQKAFWFSWMWLDKIHVQRCPKSNQIRREMEGKCNYNENSQDFEKQGPTPVLGITVGS